MTLLVWAVAGGVAGYIAASMWGEREHLCGYALLGAAGAIVGGMLSASVGRVPIMGFDWQGVRSIADLMVAVLFALAVIAGVRYLVRKWGAK